MPISSCAPTSLFNLLPPSLSLLPLLLCLCFPRYIKGKPASQVAPKVLGTAGTIVELAFKREQGPAFLTVNVALVRETPRGSSQVPKP